MLPSTRSQVMDDANKTRPGRQAAVANLRMYAWWPDMLKGTERLSQEARSVKKTIPGKTVSKWPKLRAWKKIHMDWAHIREQVSFLFVFEKQKAARLKHSRPKVTELLEGSRSACQSIYTI